MKPNMNKGTFEKTTLKETKDIIKNLASYFKKYYLGLIIVLIFAVGSAILTIFGPKIMAKATDKIVDGFININVYNTLLKTVGNEEVLKTIPKELLITKLKEANANDDVIKLVQNLDLSKKPSIDFSAVLDILIMVGIIYVLASILNYAQAFIISTISNKVSYRLRKDCFEKINKLPLSYFDKTNHGDVLSCITNDVDLLGTTISQNISQMFMTVTMIIGILIMMLTINFWMTLVAILLLPLSLILVGSIIGKSQRYFTENQTNLADVNSYVEEMYGAHLMIKSNNKENDTINEFEEFNDKLYNTSKKSQFFSGLMMPLVNFVGNIGFVLVCILGGFLVSKNQITVGNIQAFIQYVKQFSNQTGQVANIFSSLQSTLAAAKRVLIFLNEEEEAAETNKEELVIKKGIIEFKDVSFGYNEDKMIISDFNLKVVPGQKIAIVGHTGSGKTTLVKLLMRFYEINKGVITIDGVDIKNYTKASLRKNFGMVLQDTWLFNGSILDNIKYSNETLSIDEVKSIAKSIHLNHFIKTLPNDYHFVLNEEATNVSVGQKQLITIARAIASNPNILILDEATSSVDTRTEVLISNAMNILMGDKTSFIIAHRLSTIRNADMIIVMDQGKIVESGNHDELIKLNKSYASLYNSQFNNQEI